MVDLAIRMDGATLLEYARSSKQAQELVSNKGFRIEWLQRHESNRLAKYAPEIKSGPQFITALAAAQGPLDPPTGERIDTLDAWLEMRRTLYKFKKALELYMNKYADDDTMSMEDIAQDDNQIEVLNKLGYDVNDNSRILITAYNVVVDKDNMELDVDPALLCYLMYYIPNKRTLMYNTFTDVLATNISDLELRQEFRDEVGNPY